MTRLFIWGVDSLDIELIDNFLPKLPAFRRMREESPRFQYDSTQPPDSHTAWPSIYTGLNPAQHGIVDFVDPLEKSQRKLNAEVDNTAIRGKTFWDWAGDAGMRSCVLFPHVGYPVWKTNGLMTARDEIAGEVQAEPRDLVSGEHLDDLMVLKGMPVNKESLNKYLGIGHALIEKELEFTKRMYAKEDWDLFFTYSSVSDWFCHFFWNFHDPRDPSYPGEGNEFEHVIEDLYIRYDKVLGAYLDLVEDDTHVMVLSDHGHGMRPPRVVNLNEVMREHGWYVPKVKRANVTDSYYVIDRVRRAGASFINKNRWTWEFAKKLINFVPPLKKFYTSPISVDWTRTKAYTTDQSGIKSYNYGGININRSIVSDDEYEPLRDEIITTLKQVRHPDDGSLMVEMCIKREDLYQGPHIDMYPDLVFELKEGYGAGWATNAPLLQDAPTHNICPGSHRKETSVMLITGIGDRDVRTHIDPMDVAPTVADLLDIKAPNGIHGRSLFETRGG